MQSIFTTDFWIYIKITAVMSRKIERICYASLHRKPLIKGDDAACKRGVPALTETPPFLIGALNADQGLFRFAHHKKLPVFPVSLVLEISFGNKPQGR